MYITEITNEEKGRGGGGATKQKEGCYINTSYASELCVGD